MFCSDILCSLLQATLITVFLIKVFAYVTLGRTKSNACLVGKTVLVTGGNSGLGYQTALALAGRGAKVIIADKDDATLSKESIMKHTGNHDVITKFLDLSCFESVRRFAKDINDTEQRLDILINNAGVGAAQPEYTEAGKPATILINHLGGFLLTHLLIDLLKKSAPSRIIFTSSLLAFTNNLSLESLDQKSSIKNEFLRNTMAYGNSKLCNIITSNEFARKLEGTGVTSNSAHPGFVSTPIYQKSFSSYKFALPLMQALLIRLYAKSPYDGAQTQINCAVSNQLRDTTGKFFSDCRPLFQPPKTSDGEFCEKIWTRSEELVQLKPSEKLTN